MIQTLIFYIFASVLVMAALSVISVKNPVHSVLSLVICFIASSGLFILIGAEYIALTLMIIYVGAISILFLFIVMMLDINFTILRQSWYSYMPLCIIIAIILMIDLYILFNSSLRETINLSPRALPIDESLTNTAAIGRVLYTDYVLPFQLAGLILLVAMISAIVLTHRVRPNVKKQNINQQLLRSKKDGLEIVKVESGQGV